jgi:aminopeptidase N
VGIPGEAKVESGRKTVVWKSDHPVRFFNLVGGPLVETKGKVASIFHSPRHIYRTQRMVEMLDAARTYYSEWFHPYPWRDLKITEFPGVAAYAQGFPGNISFSEGIGFLTKNDEDTEHDLADFVVAHESAHQWWGNIVTPGKGPGGNVLSEGMANFAAAMLVGEVRGEGARRSLMRQFESQYGRTRSKDNERPLHRVTGSRPGDTTIMYDRGGWVLWMLCRHLGREQMFAGLQAFTLKFKDGPDYPLMEDLVEAMRPFAKDAAAYDTFVAQWVLGSVAPEFTFEKVTKEKLADGTWRVTGTLKNVGAGELSVEIAARDEASMKPKAAQADAKEPSAWKAPSDLGRTSVKVSGAAEVAFELTCSSEPAQVLADPDITVLQIGRNRAVATCELKK